KGPVTRLREMVIPKNEPGIPLDAVPKSIYSDMSGVSPHTATLVEYTDLNEKWRDVWDGKVARYVELLPDGRPGTRIFTDTELQLELALHRPGNVKPVLVRIRPDMLQPVGISALVGDLPEAGSDRIWFLPGTKNKPDLLAVYARMMQADADPQAAMYTQLMTQG